MHRIGALTMRKQFGKYLDLVAKKKQPVMISRANQPLVVMVPAEEYEQFARGGEARARREAAAKRMDEIRARILHEVGPVDVVALVRRSRDRR